MVQAGRFVLPMANDYRDEIADLLGDQLGVQVAIRQIDGRWVGLKPEITIQDLRLTNKRREQVLAVESLHTQFDLLRSLFNWRLAWTDFSIDELSVALQQYDDGQIYLRGVLPGDRSEEDAGALSPWELLLLRGRVELSAVKLEYYPLEGEPSVWQLPELVMENTQSFHRLRAQLNSDGRPLLNFVFEGEGDPRDRETFLASSYLELNYVKVSELAEQFRRDAWEAFPQREQLQDVALTGKLWVVKLPGSFLELSGHLQADGGRLPLPSIAKLDISGVRQSEGDWQLSLQNMNARFNDFDLPEPLNVGLEFGSQTPLTLRASRIDVGYWYGLAEQHNWLPDGELKKVLGSLQPSGHVNNLYLRLGKDVANDFLLQANLEQMAAGAWLGAPAVSGVDGYIETTAKRGFVDIDSRQGFSMHYTTVYDDAQRFEQMRGQVQWVLDRDKNSIFVNSGQLEMQQGDTQVRGAMQLYTPWFANTAPSDLTLFIGLRNDKVSNYPKYLPNVVPDSLKKFLADAKGEGVLRSGAFIYRGGLKANLKNTYTTQLALELEDTALNYMPGWPRLSGVDSRLEVDGRFLHASAKKGESLGLQIQDIQIDLENNPKAAGDRLSVQASFQGDAQQGLDFLLNSPIAQSQAATFQDWELFGKLSGAVDLKIPMSLSVTKGAQYDINAKLNTAELYIPELALHFEDIDAHLNYDALKGLSGKNLQAKVWGQALVASLSSSASRSLLEFDSQLPIAPLAQWMNMPSLLMADGQAAVRGQLQLPSTRLKRAAKLADNELTLTTDMQGIAINLPAPYGKTAEQQRETTIRIPIPGGETIAAGAVQEQLHLRYALDEGSTTDKTDNYLALAVRQHREGESLAVGLKGTLPETQAGQALISGQLKRLDLEPWLSIVGDHQQAQSRYQDLREPQQANSQLPEQEAIPFGLDLQVEELYLAGLSVPNIQLQASQTQQGILLNADSEMLAGSLEYFDSDRPLDVRVHHLILPEFEDDTEEAASNDALVAEPSLDDKAADQESANQSWDFSAFPQTQVQIDRLAYAQRELGNWRMQIQAGGQKGLMVDRIFGELGDIKISGKLQAAEGGDATASVDPGAHLHWLGGPLSSSDLFARIQFKNIDTLSQQWQMPSILESEQAQFDLNMSWPASPMDFDSTLIAGSLDLDIRNGRFFQSAGAGGNAVLRLLSVLNFDTWVRRLRLDFADLYKEGMVFDSVTGHIDFQQQELLIQEPIIVKGPSSRLQFAGKIDWADESLDTSLVATLPVGNNVALATGLLVSWPAAAGVYLASKLFSNQVDKVASVSYSMNGSWAEPEMKFDRLFDSKAAKDAGEKVAEEVELQQGGPQTIVDDSHVEAQTDSSNELDQDQSGIKEAVIPAQTDTSSTESSPQKSSPQKPSPQKPSSQKSKPEQKEPQ